MDYIGFAIGIALLIVLNKLLTVISFDGYLGKLISLILLIFITSKNFFLGIIGVTMIIKQHGMDTEPMDNNESRTQKKAKKADFRNQYCKKGSLEKDGKTISTSDLKSAFPNIEFAKDSCNPCSESCDFQIISSKEQITNEQNLRPKNSKEQFVNKNNR